MANAVTKANAPALPAALAALKTNIQTTVARLPASGQKGFLNFTKFGTWGLGQDNEDVTGEEVAVNVLGIKTGFICWSDDDKKRKDGPLGTVAVPIGQAVDPSDLDRSLPGKWVDYVEVPVKFLGEDFDGEEAVFNSNSKGGVDAVRGLLDKIVGRLNENRADFVPVVALKGDHYIHKTYGKTFFPVLDITGWLTMDGAAAGEAEAPEPEDEPEAPAAEAPAGARRRRRA